MVTERQRRAQETANQMTDGYIKDRFKDMICGSKNYYDNMTTNSIGSLIAKADGGRGGGTGVNRYMTLYVKHYDIPDEILDSIWKLNKAERIFKLFNEAVIELFKMYYPPELEEHWDIEYENAECKIDIDDNDLVVRMGHLQNDYFLDKLVMFDCVIMNKTDINLKIEENVFTCINCGNKQSDKTRKCAACSEAGTIKHSLTDSKKVSYEVMRVQERQDDVDPRLISTTLHVIDILVKGSLINRFKPGDNVRVTGIVKPWLDGPKQEALNKKVSNDFVSLDKIPFIVEVHNIKFIGTPQDVILADPKKYLTDHDMKAILGLRKKYTDIQLLNVLKNSFAPNIYGQQAIKEALLIQAVGPGHIPGKRSWINIALFGDAGVGKTELADTACRINMHYAKAVGKGASGVGLTASIIKDERGMSRLSAGAAVLADKGLCFIDEFSNIPDEYKEHLRECMESGKLTINKQGVNQTLNARGPYLIVSNPDSGKYRAYDNLTDNISISPALLSRFDAIFIMVDNVNKKEDQKVRMSITAQFNNKPMPKVEGEETVDKIDEELLKKYIFYAKTRTDFVDILPEAFKGRFDGFHDDLRTPEKSSDITATHRQFEGILRISKAIARLLLKTKVDEDVADFTIKLLNFAYESTGMKFGNSVGLNQTAIYSKPLYDLKPKRAFILVFENLTKDNTQAVEKEAVINELRISARMSISDCYELWEKMDRMGALMVENGRFYKLNYDNLLS